MNRRPLIAAGTLLGVGLGGFVDGIVFHQLLQVHNMLSAIVPPDNLVNAKINMVWDGVFHSLTWLCTTSRIGGALARRWARRCSLVGADPVRIDADGVGTFQCRRGYRRSPHPRRPPRRRATGPVSVRLWVPCLRRAAACHRPELHPDRTHGPPPCGAYQSVSHLHCSVNSPTETTQRASGSRIRGRSCSVVSHPTRAGAT